MKPMHVAFREAIYHDGKGTVSAADASLELHPAGMLVQVKGRKRLLVPWSNIKWVEVESEKKA